MITGAVTQLGNARQKNERLFGISNSAVSNSLYEGKAFRDDNFNHAALAAIESIEEAARQEVLNKIQFVLALLGAIPGPIGIGFNLLNAEISKARGNAEAARDYTIYAIPFVGGVYGLGQLGVMLGQYTASKISQAISAKPDEQTQLPIVHRINWVSGPGGGNSFVAGTGVVTGVDEDGNLITTAIEDLEVGDVVLAGNELDPTDPTSYELVTATSHRTVYELTEVTYVDDQGNVEVIKATDNHEFYVEHVGWVKAEALQQGSLLRLTNGRTATVTRTTTLDMPEGVEVYNLTVTDGKTYFVDDGQGEVSAAWVHNRAKGWLKFWEGKKLRNPNGTISKGHTIERHVGKSVQYLLNRVKKNKYIYKASTFKNQDIAEQMIAATIRHNRASIRIWAKTAGKGAKEPFKLSTSTIIGYGVKKGKSGVNDLTNVKVVLQSYGDGKKWRILTAHPI
ncbi:MAG: RNase A-like domain-containing protein [Planctomycetota bacterium]